MSNFVIHREHGISKAQAFEITEDWIVSAEKDYKMHCDIVRSDEQIRVNFSRAGVTGTLTVDDKVFDMQAKLGFLSSVAVKPPTSGGGYKATPQSCLHTDGI